MVSEEGKDEVLVAVLGGSASGYYIVMHKLSFVRSNGVICAYLISVRMVMSKQTDAEGRGS